MLTLTIIARDAEDTIGRTLRSALPFVDRAVVVLAGASTDRTRDVVADLLAVDAGEEPHVIVDFLPEHNGEAFFPDGALADYAAARNVALQHVPAGSHWLFLDADDELQDGADLARHVEKLEAGEVDLVALPYDYFHDDAGAPTQQQATARIFSGKVTDWQWRDRVHEWCHTEQPARILRAAGPRVKHLRTQPATARNLRLLELMLREDPENKRALLHYADALYGSARYEEALDAYARYYADPKGEPEQFYVACQAAKCAGQLRDFATMAQWAMCVVDMRPTFKDGWLLRAEVANHLGRAEEALFWLDQAADKLENTAQTAVVVFRHDYTWNPLHTQFSALYALRRFPEAVQVAELAARMFPQSPQWVRELELAREAVRIERSVAAAAALVDHFVCRGDTLNAWKAIQDENLPMTIRQDERIVGLRAEVWDAVKHVFDRKAYREFYTSEVAGHEINGTAIDRYRLEPVLQSLRKRGARRVLEVGTGAGGPLIWLAERMPECQFVGLDINGDLVELANRSARARGLGERVLFLQSNMQDYMAEPRERFDACLLLELIEHMTPQDAYLHATWGEEIAGAVIITTPAMFCSDIPSLGAGYPRDHVKEWSLSDLEQLVFKVPRRRPLNIFKMYAPARDDEWKRVLPDGDEAAPLDYVYPGFANWLCEFDGQSRHNPPVVFYCGQGPDWSPLDFEERGLGGAETMAVKMAEEFARNAHPVAVYADWTGVRNGVIYRHWSEFNPQKPYLGVDTWLFVSSRLPEVFDHDINADVKWLWNHDVNSGPIVTPERVAKVDRCLVLSEWHRKHWLEVYPWFPREKLVVTSNAVDPALFPDVHDMAENGARPALERRPHRFIWPSSPDRGLDQVLAWWPEIRKQWPDAELHVFYGWDTVDWMMQMPGREWLRWFKAKIEDLGAQPGVYFRGRLPARELYREMAQAQFWLYPSQTAFDLEWDETFCIAAVEALACGVTPVIADAGALRERLADVGMEDHLVEWKAPLKRWLHALRRFDRMPNAAEIERRRAVLFETRSFAALYRQWMRLVLRGELEDAGKVPAVVSTTSGGA